MKYHTYLPCDALKPFVKSFALSEASEEKIYKVLPSTGLVIGFQYKGSLSQLEDNKLIPLSAFGLTGLHDSYRMFKNAQNTGTILVYFQEGGAAAFFQQPLHEIFRKSVSLDNFMLHSQLMIVEEQLGKAKTEPDKIKVVEQFLLGRIRSVSPDTLVLTALALIHRSKGIIRIKDLTQQLHISQSPLEKRFRAVVGTSPKKFASIIRLKHTLQTYHPQNSLTELGYQAGFYDQAHFIKEFKQFTGQSPQTFFANQ